MIDNQLTEKINMGIPEKQPRELTVSLQDAAVQLENHQIWDNAFINVEQGEFIAVVGPNGSGKSTLFRVLLGMQPLSQGQVRVLGEIPHRGNQSIGCFTGTGTTPTSAAGGGNAESRRSDSLCRPADRAAFRRGAAAAGARAGTCQ